MIITGASSGIGRATAELAASKGATVVLAARDIDALELAASAIRSRGGRALAVECDVSRAEQIEALAMRALEHYGGFDTWVNNAGLSIYGRLDEVPIEDQRALFDVNYWGAVSGSLTAARVMAQNGGVIINVGSVVSDRAIPLQGAYCASKHALKAFTDTLRMEIDEADLPIAISLVKPASIDTPFFEHARTYMDADPRPVPPVYAASEVARAIVRCAERPVRDLPVGGASRAMGLGGFLAPRLTDLYMERSMFSGQQREPRPRPQTGNLEVPQPPHREAGDYEGHVMRSSAYTRAVTSDAARIAPRLVPFVAAGLALALASRPRAPHLPKSGE
jgi:NAD(P)-dependent dehydrogenase (short-subunit alcohol dehydrogenase family)